MSLRDELLRESKALASNLEDIKNVAGDTDLLRQTSRVLALAAKCVGIMGNDKPGAAYKPPESKALGRTLYTRDRRTTAETNTGYVGAFEGERNIASAFVSNREALSRKLVAQTTRADRMNHHAKVCMSKLSIESERFQRAEKLLESKLLVAQNDKKKLLRIGQRQEATIDEQARIIEGLKYKLKRRWDTDPIIDISPRTRNIAKNVVAKKKKSKKKSKVRGASATGVAAGKEDPSSLPPTHKSAELVPTRPAPASDVVEKEDQFEECIESANASFHRLCPFIFDNHELECRVIRQIEDAVKTAIANSDIEIEIQFGKGNNSSTETSSDMYGKSKTLKMRVRWRELDEDKSMLQACLLNQNREECVIVTLRAGEGGVQVIDRTGVEKVMLGLGSSLESFYYSSLLAKASQDCFHAAAVSKNSLELWEALESIISNCLSISECKLYQVDPDRGHLVRITKKIDDTVKEASRFTRKLQDSIFVNEVTHASKLKTVELRYKLSDGKCVFGKIGSTYRGYAIRVVRNREGEIAMHKLKDPNFVAYAPYNCVMVIPIFADNNAILGCIECMGNHEFTAKEQAFGAMLSSKVAVMITMNKKLENMKLQVKTKSLLLNALKPENLAKLSLPSLLETLTMKTKLVLNAERCVWYILDKDRGVLWSQLIREGKKIKLKLSSKGIVGRVFQTKSSINVRNVKEYLKEKHDSKDPLCIGETIVSKDYLSIVGSVKSTLAIPMIGEDKSIMGVVQVFNKQNSHFGFGAEDQTNLEIISRHGCVAIQNSFVLKEAHKSNSIGLDFTSDVKAVDVLNRVITLLLRDTHAEHAVIYMYNKEDHFMQLYNPRQKTNSEDNSGVVEWNSVSTDGLAGQCAATGATINVEDGTFKFDARVNKEVNRLVMGMQDATLALQHVTATLLEPVRNEKGNVIAVLQVINKNKTYSNRGAFSFDRIDCTRIHNIASQAAISLQNALLHEEAANSHWRMRELLDTSLSLTREHNIDSLLSLVSVKAKGVLECEECSLWLVEGNTEKVLVMQRNETSGGNGSKNSAKSMDKKRLNEGIIGKVALTRKTKVISSDHDLSKTDIMHSQKNIDEITGALCIPLISSHDEVLGVLFVINKLGGREFLEEDLALAAAFCAQATTAIENVRMFEHLGKLRQYSKSIAPTTNNFVFTLDVHGHLVHASHDPKYVLGLELDFMKAHSYKHWLGHRNHVLEHHLEQVYKKELPCSIKLTNASYHNQHGQTTIMNAAISPIFSTEMALEGISVCLTQIKRHATLAVLEGRIHSGVKRIAWPNDPQNKIPHRYIHTDKEPPPPSLECNNVGVERSHFDSKACVLAITIDLTFEEGTGLNMHRKAPPTSESYHILRDIKRSTFVPDEEQLNSKASEKFSGGNAARISAQDFLGKLLFDIYCLVNENAGTIDRVYNSKTIIAIFGTKGQQDTKWAGYACQTAIKVTDLAKAFQVELSEYYEKYYNNATISPQLSVSCGLHTGVVHMSKPLDTANETDDIDEDQEEDAPQIFRTMEEDVDLSIEMTLHAQRLGVSHIISPHGRETFTELMSSKDLLIRKVETTSSLTLQSSLEIFELVGYKELGEHDPGFLRAMKYFKTGLDAYENGQYDGAAMRFRQALALSHDKLTKDYLLRCGEKM